MASGDRPGQTQQTGSTHRLQAPELDWPAHPELSQMCGPVPAVRLQEEPCTWHSWWAAGSLSSHSQGDQGTPWEGQRRQEEPDHGLTTVC